MTVRLRRVVWPAVFVAAFVVFIVVAVFPTGSLRWDDLGGLMGGDGAPAVLPASALGATPGDDERGVDPTSLFGTWRDLVGVGSCRLVQGASMMPTWVPVVARLAGADPVHLRLDSSDALGGRGRDVLWPWFVTEVELGEGVDASAVAARWPRLAALALEARTERDADPAPAEEEVAR